MFPRILGDCVQWAFSKPQTAGRRRLVGAQACLPPSLNRMRAQLRTADPKWSGVRQSRAVSGWGPPLGFLDSSGMKLRNTSPFATHLNVLAKNGG